MEDTTTTPETPADAPVTAPVVEDTSATDEAAQTFSADYVRELRREAAENRVRAKLTDAANDRLLASYVNHDGRLIDPDLITVSPELVGEDGLVDPVKVTAAIDTLIAEKPNYMRAKPAPVPQGVREEAPTERSLFALMRERL